MADEGQVDVEHWGQPADLAGEGHDDVGGGRIPAAMGDGEQGWLAHAVASRSGSCAPAADRVSRSRSRTTSPITTTAGGRTPARSASAATPARVVISTC